MSGQIQYLYIKPAHGQPMKTVAVVEAETGLGLIGDASYGRSKRQVLLVERETLSFFDLAPGQLRENVTVEGVSLSGRPVGTQIQAGGVLLEITGDCAPCRLVDDIREGLRAEMVGRRGMLCRVLRGGEMRLNDEVRIVSPDPA